MLLRSWFITIILKNKLTYFNQGWPQFTIFPGMATFSKFEIFQGMATISNINVSRGWIG